MNKMGLDAAAMEGFAGAIRNSVPLQRFGTSGEVAKLVTFLAGDDSSFITGSEYIVDGGISVNAVMS